MTKHCRNTAAKIGFDIDNPRNGTLLPSEMLKGPIEAGRKQAVHSGGHPGYIEALTAKLEDLSSEFRDQVRKIPHPAGSAAYEAEYKRVVMDMQTKVHELQNKCRDALHKGMPLMGDTTAIEKQWTAFLK